MGQVVIDYNEISNSARDAGKVADKLDAYASALQTSIYKKLQSYSGDHTSNIQSALGHTNGKIRKLNEKADAYRTYGKELEDLRSACVNTDTAVSTKIKELSAQFRNSNKIQSNTVLDSIHSFFTRIENSTVAGRWIKSIEDHRAALLDYLHDSIKTWWNYEGGKQVVTGFVKGVIEVVVAVVGIVVAFISGAAVVALIAACIGGAIAIANGIVNCMNEVRAYKETNENGDPAYGRRLSAENTAQDTLRKESDEKWAHVVADGLDFTVKVCDAIDMFNSLGDLVKNGYKWTYNTFDMDDLKIKDILTKDTNLKPMTNLKNFGKDFFKKATHLENYSIGRGWKSFGSDFLNCLKKKYLDFSNAEKGLKTIKNYLNIAKEFDSTDDINLKKVLNVGWDKVIKPNIPVVRLFDDGSVKTDYIKESDFSFIKDIGDLVEYVSGGFDTSTISKDLMSKLSMRSEIVSVPEINIPDVKLPPLRSGISAVVYSYAA